MGALPLYGAGTTAGKRKAGGHEGIRIYGGHNGGPDRAQGPGPVRPTGRGCGGQSTGGSAWRRITSAYQWALAFGIRRWDA